MTHVYNKTPNLDYCANVFRFTEENKLLQGWIKLVTNSCALLFLKSVFCCLWEEPG